MQIAISDAGAGGVLDSLFLSLFSVGRILQYNSSGIDPAERANSYTHDELAILKHTAGQIGFDETARSMAGGFKCSALSPKSLYSPSVPSLGGRHTPWLVSACVYAIKYAPYTAFAIAGLLPQIKCAVYDRTSHPAPPPAKRVCIAPAVASTHAPDVPSPEPPRTGAHPDGILMNSLPHSDVYWVFIGGGPGSEWCGAGCPPSCVVDLPLWQGWWAAMVATAATIAAAPADAVGDAPTSESASDAAAASYSPPLSANDRLAATRLLAQLEGVTFAAVDLAAGAVIEPRAAQQHLQQPQPGEAATPDSIPPTAPRWARRVTDLASSSSSVSEVGGCGATRATSGAADGDNDDTNVAASPLAARDGGGVSTRLPPLAVRAAAAAAESAYRAVGGYDDVARPVTASEVARVILQRAGGRRLVVTSCYVANELWVQGACTRARDGDGDGSREGEAASRAAPCGDGDSPAGAAPPGASDGVIGEDRTSFAVALVSELMRGVARGGAVVLLDRPRKSGGEAAEGWLRALAGLCAPLNGDGPLTSALGRVSFKVPGRVVNNVGRFAGRFRITTRGDTESLCAVVKARVGAVDQLGVGV